MNTLWIRTILGHSLSVPKTLRKLKLPICCCHLAQLLIFMKGTSGWNFQKYFWDVFKAVQLEGITALNVLILQDIKSIKIPLPDALLTQAMGNSWKAGNGAKITDETCKFKRCKRVNMQLCDFNGMVPSEQLSSWAVSSWAAQLVELVCLCWVGRCTAPAPAVEVVVEVVWKHS